MIEEFMLLANRRVAEFCGKRRTESGRVGGAHDGLPRARHPERGETRPLPAVHPPLRAHLQGYEGPRRGQGTEQALQTDQRERTEENAVATMAVRSMAKAYYTTDNIGHYGLAFPYYTHFTSPIRRYPDMMVHRLLARYLAGGKPADKTRHSEDLCARASDREVDGRRGGTRVDQIQDGRIHERAHRRGVRGTHLGALPNGASTSSWTKPTSRAWSFLRDIEGDFFTVRRAALRNHRPLDGHPHDAGQPGTHPREARRPAETPVRLRIAAARGRGAPYGRAPRQRPEGAHLVAPQRTVVTERAPVRP